MTTINQQIWGTLRNNRLQEKYYFDDTRVLVESFLKEDKLPERTELAQMISKKTLTKHKKDGSLHPFLSRMVNIERGVQYFDKYLRDHINHSVYVYLLGLAFIEKTPFFRNIDPLSWKITALLHDVGYPPEWFAYSTRKYLKQVLEASETTAVSDRGMKYSVRIDGIEKLEFSKIDAFRTIDDRLRTWNIELNTRKVFRSRLSRGEINHGILSALAILRIVDHLYYMNNSDRIKEKIDDQMLDWGTECFGKQIVEAVTAVSIHAILGELSEIQLENTPIAYLLVLCDTLQLWNRYSPRRKTYGPNDVTTDFEADNPRFEFNVGDDDFKGVEDVVNNKLLAKNFRVQVQKRPC
jgi:hypothetical protein